MRIAGIPVSFTMNLPYDRPDKNGNIYTREAIENALKHCSEIVPIVECFNNKLPEKIIGYTDGTPYAVQADEESKTIRYNIDGHILHGGLNGIVKDRNDKGEITEFEITSFGVSD